MGNADQLALLEVGPVRVATHGDTSAWAIVPELPLTEPANWDGHRIVWADWDFAPQVTHIHDECGSCGYDGRPLMSHAVQHPNVGETFATRETRRLKSGRTYARDVDVPAWPVVRVFAFLCPACGDLRFYDQFEDRDPS